MSETYWLRFADAGAALAALAAAGMAVETIDPETGEARTVVPSPGYLDGVRFDVLPVGGDGVWREPDGVETVEVDGVSMEMPRLVARAGYHVDLVWHGSPETAPDVSAFIATTAGAWSYSDAPAAGLSEPVPSSVSRFQARAALREAGLLEPIEAAVAAADDLTREAWASAIAFERMSPTIATLAAALGLSSAQVDDLFRRAAMIRA